MSNSLRWGKHLFFFFGGGVGTGMGFPVVSFRFINAMKTNIF